MERKGSYGEDGESRGRGYDENILLQTMSRRKVVSWSRMFHTGETTALGIKNPNGGENSKCSIAILFSPKFLEWTIERVN